MTYFDTHVAIWLLTGARDLPKRSQKIIEADDDLLISPMVLLDLQNLHEIGRLKETPHGVLRDLNAAIGLRVCDYPFSLVIEQAIKESWTRDPFDRMIVAHARAQGAALISFDELIRKNYELAVW
jgi:PIN domain nuclease of toxin-antitoxin system